MDRRSATSASVRITASGVRSSCEASAVKRRISAKERSSRPIILLIVSVKEPSSSPALLTGKRRCK